MSLEETIAYVREDEIIEITAKAIRLRKIELDSGKRKTVRANQQRCTAQQQ